MRSCLFRPSPECPTLPMLSNEVPEAIRKSFLSSDGHATLIELLPTAALTPNEQIRWVREVRSSDVAAITGVPGATLRVGGVPARDADYDAVVKERLPKVILFVVLGSLLALLIGLRSLFAAIKAILLNLLSVGASFGALVLVFQEGHGSRLFGLHGPTGTVFPIVPILSFAIVFGLSMDYEVFLVARVLEERRRGLIREIGGHRGPGADGRAHHQRRGNHDCRLHRIHPGRLSRRPDAGLYARRSGVHRCNRGADDRRAGASATCRRLELVAAWPIWCPGSVE